MIATREASVKWDLVKIQQAKFVEDFEEERGDCTACQGTGIATSGDPDGDCTACRGVGLETTTEEEFDWREGYFDE
jgi:DnaJ-class molecular chaperone